MYALLIVDDELWVRKLLSKLIDWETLGFRVVALAGDGREGLAACFRHRIDLVVTDIRMPGVDGMNFMADLRVLYPKVQVIVVTGHAEFPLAQGALRHGALDYLVKPVDEEGLRGAVLRAKAALDARAESARQRRDLEKRVHRFQLALGSPGPSSPTVANPTIRRALELILGDLSVRSSLTVVAETLGVHPTYFSELFKKEVGVGFQEFGTEVRMAKAEELVGRTGLRIKDIAEGLGFQDPDYFAKVFRQRTGLTPLAYRQATSESEIELEGSS